MDEQWKLKSTNAETSRGILAYLQQKRHGASKINQDVERKRDNHRSTRPSHIYQCMERSTQKLKYEKINLKIENNYHKDSVVIDTNMRRTINFVETTTT